VTAPVETHSRLGAWRVAAFLAPIVLLLPFAGKPYQADDHVFIWVAEQIAKHPFDFFGFEVDYGVEKVPIHMVNHNPPAVQYWLALVGVATDWNIVALHLAMSLFVGLAAIGLFELARDFGVRPGRAAALGVLTPAFLVSASTLMTDVALLACYVWAILAWRRGFVRGSQRWIAVAMVCAGFAPLVKFFGITLLPLLLLDGMLRTPRPRGWWIWLAIPCASFAAFQIYMQVMYGVTSLSAAANVALAEKWRTGETFATRPLLTLVFLGGSLLPLAIPAAVCAGARLSGVAAVLAIMLAAPLLGGYSLAQLFIGESEPYAAEVLIHLGVFVFAGAVIMVAAARELMNHATDDAVMLGAWIGGTLGFTVFLNHYISVRTLLPMLPALVILLAPGLERMAARALALAGGALLSAWLLVADYDVAEHDRLTAERAIALAKERNVPLNYIAFWGFEYYLMKAGAQPLAFAEKASMAEPTRPLMSPGDLLVVDAYAAAPWIPPPGGFEIVERESEAYSAGATTFDTHAAAGFYSHRIGVLPFRVGRTGPEEFLVLRWAPK